MNKLQNNNTRIVALRLAEEIYFLKATANPIKQRIKDLEDQLDDVQGRVHSIEREGVVGDFYD